MIKKEKRVRYILSSPLDGGNRGCEAICKGTAQVLNLPKTQLVSYSTNVKLDEKLGLSKRMKLLSCYGNCSSLVTMVYRFVKLLPVSNNVKQILNDMHIFLPLLCNIEKTDIMLSDGGDLFCYENMNIIYGNLLFHLMGKKNILWGCSIGKENLDKKKVRLLNTFDAIVTRESYTFKLLKHIFPQKKIYCIPDPAFCLDPELCDLPDCFFQNDVLGMNISNFIGKENGLNSLFGRNLINLIDYVLDTTNMFVVLIPHVFWKDQDDTKACKMIKDRYKNNDRVQLIRTHGLNYCQIRYMISKCKYFVGARTHAMISAYAMSVPALALGYSIKSKGIAKDIGLDKELVIDYNQLRCEDELISSFCYLVNNEQKIRMCYQNSISNYIKNTYKLKSVIDKLL